MKIKVKTTKEQKKNIEDQLKRWEGGFESAKRAYEEEIIRLEKQIKEYKDFWENNEKKIFESKSYDRKYPDKDKLFETKTVFKNTGKISISSLNEMSIWVCQYCGNEPFKKYINAGSHRDYDYDVCDCAGAKKNGKPYCKLV